MTVPDKDSKLADAPATDIPQVKLKDPLWAGVLAWLVPGLGHFYQGRWAKAILFSTCILALFATGIAFGSAPEDPRIGYARVVYIDTNSVQDRWAIVPQAGIGLAALPAFYQWYRAKNDQLGDSTFMAPMKRHQANDIHYVLGAYFELGTVFTMIAGLLNILVIFDAVSGPVIIVDDSAGASATPTASAPEAPPSEAPTEETAESSTNAATPPKG
jgi:hypothetical protein